MTIFLKRTCEIFNKYDLIKKASAMEVREEPIKELIEAQEKRQQYLFIKK